MRTSGAVSALAALTVVAGAALSAQVARPPRPIGHSARLSFPAGRAAGSPDGIRASRTPWGTPARSRLSLRPPLRSPPDPGRTNKIPRSQNSKPDDRTFLDPLAAVGRRLPGWCTCAAPRLDGAGILIVDLPEAAAGASRRAGRAGRTHGTSPTVPETRSRAPRTAAGRRDLEPRRLRADEDVLCRPDARASTSDPMRDVHERAVPHPEKRNEPHAPQRVSFTSFSPKTRARPGPS